MPHFQFDPEHHVYTCEGVRVESVTGVLTDNAMLPDYSALDPFYRVRGTAVHQAIALDLLGRLDEDSLDEHTRPYLARARRFLETLAIEPLVIEQPWVCHVYRYGGINDLFGSSKLGPVLIDWKAGQWEPAHAVQAAGGYLPLLEQAADEGAIPVEPRDVRRCRVAVVNLTQDLPKPVWVEREGQIEIFRAALACTRWRRAAKVRNRMKLAA